MIMEESGIWCMMEGFPLDANMDELAQVRRQRSL